MDIGRYTVLGPLSDHVDEVDWGKDVGKEIISDDTDCICSFEIDEDTKDKVMVAAAKYK